MIIIFIIIIRVTVISIVIGTLGTFPEWLERVLEELRKSEDK